MALLTADDVLNKKFQSVKFREGYDQVEVDEFLDEVVATIYALGVENAELKEKLEAADRRIAELSSGEPISAPTVVVEPEPEPELEIEPAPEPVVVVTPEPPAAESSPESAASMLALAQRLHDEYVADGRAEGERIIRDARQKGAEIVTEAEDKRDGILNRLEQERGALETRINELRSFEQDYRSTLTSHLEGLLTSLQASAE